MKERISWVLNGIVGKRHAFILIIILKGTNPTKENMIFFSFLTSLNIVETCISEGSKKNRL